MLTRTLLIAALCGSAIVAHAETAYVTDSLRLGIHAAEDTSDDAFENLVSGTAVEVLERKANYARVKLADGREGWVRAAFLVTGKTAQLRVAELEARIGVLEAELAAAARSPQAPPPGEPLERVDARPAIAAESAAAIEGTINRLQRDNRLYEEQLEGYRRSLPLGGAAAALVLALVGGFVAGVWWIDQRIRNRHGGFRIY
jgi:SH3 domain protein